MTERSHPEVTEDVVLRVAPRPPGDEVILGPACRIWGCGLAVAALLGRSFGRDGLRGTAVCGLFSAVAWRYLFDCSLSSVFHQILACLLNTDLNTESGQASQGSFSVVSKPIFAIAYSLCREGLRGAAVCEFF